MKKLIIVFVGVLMSLSSFASNGRIDTKPAIEKQILIFSPPSKSLKSFAVLSFEV